MTSHLPDSTARAFTLSDFDFDLPPERIAQHPTPERSGSRLLDGHGDAPCDRIFRELPALLRAGDLLVFNDTRVVKARIFGEKDSGGKLELLIERVLTGNAGCEVVAHMKVSKKPPVGARIHLAGGVAAGGFDATLLSRWPDAEGPLFRFALHGPAGATRPAATTPTPTKTPSATRRCLPAPLAQWRRPPPPCTSTTRCSPTWPRAASSAPASRCMWVRAPSSP